MENGRPTFGDQEGNTLHGLRDVEETAEFYNWSGHPKKNRSQQAGILTGSRFYETLRISVRVCDDIGLYNRLIGREYCTKQGFFKGVQFNDVYLVIQISVNILLSQCKNWLINRS